MMEVILLENLQNLGRFGATVRVANGYGRNYLIPQGKALPANKKNMAIFEQRRAELEKVVAERLAAAQARATLLSELKLTIAARAGEEGKLYGSVGTIEIVKALEKAGHEVSRQEICLPDGPMRDVGIFSIDVQLHADVVATITVEVVAE
jgi:large subunit ribosomal protein L9